MSKMRIIGYPFGAAVAASIMVVFVGLCVFGFRWADWAEWEGGVVGVIGTIAGVAGAVVGLRMASSAERRASNERITDHAT